MRKLLIGAAMVLCAFLAWQFAAGPESTSAPEPDAVRAEAANDAPPPSALDLPARRLPRLEPAAPASAAAGPAAPAMPAAQHAEMVQQMQVMRQFERESLVVLDECLGPTPGMRVPVQLVVTFAVPGPGRPAELTAVTPAGVVLADLPPNSGLPRCLPKLVGRVLPSLPGRDAPSASWQTVLTLPLPATLPGVPGLPGGPGAFDSQGRPTSAPRGRAPSSEPGRPAPGNHGENP